MASGTLSIAARPLRIAFLVDPTDRNGLLQAIQINTFLWGGMFNPVIPVFRRTPKNWEHLPVRRLPDPAALLSGYLDGFDPDLVVPIGKCENTSFSVGHRDIVFARDLLGDVVREGIPQYGIGFFEILSDFIGTELRFVPHEPVELILPTHTRSHNLFLSSALGSLPENIQQALKHSFTKRLPLKEFSSNLHNFADLLISSQIFPRKLGAWKLDIRRHEPQIFFLDATSTLDIIDYWNLRAAGYLVFPIPIQSVSSENVKSQARIFISEAQSPDKYPFAPHRTVIFQRSRSITTDKVIAFANFLKSSQHGERDTDDLAYTLREHYPRLWDSWARQNTSERISFPYSSESDISVSDNQESVEIRTLGPQISLPEYSYGTPKFANELTFRFYNSSEPMAEVFPEGSRELSTALGRDYYSHWRFSQNGPVFLATRARDRVFIKLPRAEELIMQWLSERNWQVELSVAGRMAKQIIKQVQGIRGTGLFANIKVLNLLNDMRSESGLPWQAVLQALKGLKVYGAEAYLQRLLEVQAVRLGARIQCPNCTRNNWFPLNRIDYVLRCNHCLSDFKPPSHLPKKIAWTYRAYGPFSTAGFAEGAYCVLLALRFLQGMHTSSSITPLFSYKITTPTGEFLESDLTCLYRPNFWDQAQTSVIHAECKTGNIWFAKKDAERMRKLGQEFPGAVLAFATTRMQLEKSEVRLLSRLELENRRKRFYGRPYNTVMVLTGTELFSSDTIPHCWRGKGPIYDRLRKAPRQWTNLQALCDATQEFYLGLQPWEKWFPAYGRRVDSRKRDR